jgi:hypothetical protein
MWIRWELFEASERVLTELSDGNLWMPGVSWVSEASRLATMELDGTRAMTREEKKDFTMKDVR